MLHLVVTGCNNDRIVDVRTHLDCRDNDVAEEEERCLHERGNREADPDCTLNYRNENYGHQCRLEGDEENQHDCDNRNGSNHYVVKNEGFLEVLCCGGVTNGVNLCTVVIAACNSLHLVDECEGCLVILGKIKVNDHTAVVFANHHVLGACHLTLCSCKHLALFTLKLNANGINVVKHEHNHVDKRNLVGINVEKTADRGVLTCIEHICRTAKLYVKA